MLTRLAYLIPLKRNKVLFISYLGKQYSCNPKAISEVMAEFNQFHRVWVFRNPDKYSFLRKQEVDLIQYGSLRYYIALMTYEYIITNSDLPSWISHRSTQHLIHTWHGGGAYKKVSRDYDSKYQQVINKLCSNNMTLYLSGCKAFTKYLLRGAFEYKGKVLECGLPRNDVLLSGNKNVLRLKVFKYFSIPESERVLLWAPTFRVNGKGIEVNDFLVIKEALSKKFGGHWTVLFRRHHVLDNTFMPPGVIDASDYDDMQELLAAADVLLTDYSSCMWDFSLLKRPCFLYVPDLELYEDSRGFYIDISKWPFPKSKTISGLKRCIENFSLDDYTKAIIKHHEDLGSFENGGASKTVVDYILNNT